MNVIRTLMLLMLALPASVANGAEPALSSPTDGDDRLTLRRGFVAPPRSAQIRCFWWWLNGNVTKQAVTRDLEEMKAKGFGGAMIFDADSSSHRHNTRVPAGPTFGTPAWRELFVHAVREAERLELELSLNIQSGWNLGGPAVTPSEAAKQLTWSETNVQGPTQFDDLLPVPNSRADFYQDVAVLAYKKEPAPANDLAPAIGASSSQEQFPAARAMDGNVDSFWASHGSTPGEGPSEARPQWLEFKFVRPVTVSGVDVLGRPGYGPRSCELRLLRDGQTPQSIQRFDVVDGRSGSPQFAAVEGRRFRLLILGAYDVRSSSTPRNVQVAELSLLRADGEALAGMKRRRPIRQLEQKAAFHEIGGSAPDCRPLLEDHAATAGEEDALRTNIVNLTDRLGSGGRLRWDVPRGDWVLLRFGYTITGARVSTSSAAWQGLVVDYMSTPVLESYWSRHVQPLLDDIGPLAGASLAYLHTDSWECGGMNWTAGFEDEFRRRRGYDPVPLLPVIAGKIVENRDTSNRFLADFRKTIGDCVADNHYEVFAKMSRDRGLRVHPESGGPHAGPFDALKCLGRSDMPMGEFWVPSPHRPRPQNRFFVKQAASAAHIYGKQLVAAEGFTSIGPHWEDVLWSSLKPSFDHEACAGLNLTFVHTFTCSPVNMGLPGQEYFAGTHFNPQVTWWNKVSPFVEYLNRCQFMLQQGRFVADVCYYYGDHVPNLAQRKAADPAGALPSYDYDVVNEEILLTRLTIADGRLALPSGMTYRVLVLPDHQILSLAALRKVHDLVRDGATVIGPKPNRTASLTGYPDSEKQFRQLADALWGNTQAAQGMKQFGEGRIVWGERAAELLLADGVQPDFDVESDGANREFDYIHRTVDGADVYFVSNQRPHAATVRCRFRVCGQQPEIWDPVTGQMRDAGAFRQVGSRTSLPLHFDPYGSIFVVFQRPIAAGTTGAAKRNYPIYTDPLELEGPWTVRFDTRWGGPKSAAFDRLVSWSSRPESGIRYYSGKGTYRKTFRLPAAFHGADQGVALDLGDVREIADVRLNGRKLGVLWTRPFRVEITDALRGRKHVGSRNHQQLV